MTGAGSVSLTTTVFGDARVVRLVGRISERFDASLTSAIGTSRIVVFDLDGLQAITSFGVKEFQLALSMLQVDYYCFINVRPQIVDQFNLVRHFAGKGELVSFFAPYECSQCAQVDEILIDLRHQYDLLEAGEPPPVRCSRCSGISTFEELPEQYFRHASSSPPPKPPAAASVAIDSRGQRDPVTGFNLHKEVVDRLTAFWLSGFLDKKKYLRRASEGVDGLVVIEMSGMSGANTDGMLGLASFLSGFPQGVVLARVPDSMVEPLVTLFGDLRPRGVRIVSFAFPASCRTCHTAVALELDRQQVREWRVEVPCHKCEGQMRLDVAPELIDAAARNLPMGERVELIDDYLNRNTEGMITDERDPLENATVNPEHLILGKYQVLQRLGGGGMGEAYLARHVGPQGFQKRIVLKRVRRDRLQSEVSRDLFLREARIAALLSHPNIVQVFDLERVGAEYYITMEYVEGIDLARALGLSLNEGIVWPLEVCCRVAIDLCGALGAAHSYTDEQGRPKPIVHRDVSPENVLLAGNGVVKLADFGIAYSELEHDRGGFQGKVAYSPPERLHNDEMRDDPRRDLYGVGALLFEMITVHRFASSVADRRQHEVRPPTRATFRSVPPALERVYDRAVNPEAKLRYADARAMQVDLEEALKLFQSDGRAALRELAGRLYALHRQTPAVPSRTSAAMATAQATHATLAGVDATDEDA